LLCQENQLTKLDLRQNKKLTILGCCQNQLSQLIFPLQLPNLEKLVCFGNFLTDLDFTVLGGEKLIDLSLEDNNFSAQDLSFLARFTNLRELYLANQDQAKIQQGIYNR